VRTHPDRITLDQARRPARIWLLFQSSALVVHATSDPRPVDFSEATLGVSDICPNIGDSCPYTATCAVLATHSSSLL
jgi:hypothetical protein